MSESEGAVAAAILKDLQGQRRFLIKAQSKLDRATDSMIAGRLGFSVTLPDKDRKALFDRAAAVRKLVELEEKIASARNDEEIAAKAVPALSKKERAAADRVLDRVRRSISADECKAEKLRAKAGDGWQPVRQLVVLSGRAREPFDAHRNIIEAEMEKVAQSLPVYDFVVEKVRGLGALGLAVIIGEAGALDNYASPAKLWKRLGLAVFDGRRQQKRSGDEAIRQGYSPSRRAEVWAFCSDSMMRQQWIGTDAAIRAAVGAHAAAKKHVSALGIQLTALKGEDLRALADEFGIEAEAGPLGPYGAVYMRRKAVTSLRVDPERVRAYQKAIKDAGESDRKPAWDSSIWLPARCEADARRVASKALLLDLWRVWNGKEPHDHGWVEKTTPARPTERPYQSEGMAA